MDSLLSDLRFAVRALLARPGFSAVAVLTLAIGIGVNAVAFSAVNALLYKPLRFPGVETLGWIDALAWKPVLADLMARLQDLARTLASVESIAAEGRMPLSMHDGKRTRQIWALLVTGNYFSTLRATPEIGRIFTDADSASSSEVPAMVSARFWSRARRR